MVDRYSKINILYEVRYIYSTVRYSYLRWEQVKLC